MMQSRWGIAAVVFAIAVWSAFGAGTKEAKATGVAVFVPGVVSGSPIYEMLVSGARKAVAQFPGVELKIIEAGFNQAEWHDKLVAVAASGKFSLIVTSNPALPDLCVKVARDYPKVRFFVADAYLAGNAAIHTVLYNQLEQGYLVGYLAGLVSLQANPAARKVGLIAAQTYPTLDKLIQPGFVAGLKAADPGLLLETRLVGNWYDATRAAELAKALYDSGVKVVLPIAGGAGQGVIAAAKEKGGSVVWFDGDGYKYGPDVVIGCAILRQDRLVEERVRAILGGDESLFGRADIVNASGGYIDFDSDGAGYRALPEMVREKFQKALNALRGGTPNFALSSF